MTTATKLKKGDRVRVYQDPITRQTLEGTATLQRRRKFYDRDGMTCWHVLFDGCGLGEPESLRFVSPEDRIE